MRDGGRARRSDSVALCAPRIFLMQLILYLPHKKAFTDSSLSGYYLDDLLPELRHHLLQVSFPLNVLHIKYT